MILGALPRSAQAPHTFHSSGAHSSKDSHDRDCCGFSNIDDDKRETGHILHSSKDSVKFIDQRASLVPSCSPHGNIKIIATFVFQGFKTKMPKLYEVSISWLSFHLDFFWFVLEGLVARSLAWMEHISSGSLSYHTKDLDKISQNVRDFTPKLPHFYIWFANTSHAVAGAIMEAGTVL